LARLRDKVNAHHTQVERNKVILGILLIECTFGSK